MTFEDLLGALSKTLGIEIEDAGGAAAVDIDGTVVVLQDAGEMLLMRAEIGEFPPDGKEDLLRSAMEANFLYQGTGGATLAVNPADGHLHIQKYNWLERLDADMAFDMLERFADTIAVWQKVLADYRPVAETAVPEENTGFAGGPFLKV